MPLEFLFGRKKTPEELMKQNQRALNKTIRELDRERARLEGEQKKVINDMKKMAKQGQMDAVKIMAKDLIRTRNFVKKFILMKANIQAVSLKIQTLRSTNSMAQAMKGVTRTMQRMNSAMNMPQMQKIMMEFERESATMDMKEEMMADTMDDVLGEEGDEEEGDQVVQQVLDELGIEMADKLTDLGPASGSVGVASGAVSRQPVGEGAAAAAGGDSDLEARLANLKRE